MVGAEVSLSGPIKAGALKRGDYGDRLGLRISLEEQMDDSLGIQLISSSTIKAIPQPITFALAVVLESHPCKIISLSKNKVSC